MYDTVFLCLTQADASGVDFLEAVPRFLDNVVEYRCNDVVSVTGDLNGLNVAVTDQRMRIRGGSLCKFLLGDNFQTMGRSDTQRAIEKLSDSLHLPMNKASVTRMDVAQNFIMKNPVAVYLNHLGVLRNTKRLEEPSGLYYSFNKKDSLCLYDKNREQRDKGGTIPALYRGKNVLRCERRFIKRIAAKFGATEVTGAKLYEEAFYIQVLNAWKDDYQAIQKINDIDTIDFQSVKTVPQLNKVCIRIAVQEAGGLIQFLNQIQEAQQRGEIDKVQACRLKKAINNACQETGGQTAKNEAIKELDKKVAEAVKFYR